jgi:hypothetical protein
VGATAILCRQMIAHAQAFSFSALHQKFFKFASISH